MAVIDGAIRCATCKELKPTSVFAPCFVRRGNGVCRPCNEQYYLRNRSKKLEASKARRVQPGFKEMRRQWEIPALYGITASEYDLRLREQNGVCACCGNVNENGKRLFVDHSHVTGRVRGLLCGKCNTGIGHLGDTEEGVLRAAAYLRRSIDQIPDSTVESKQFPGD